MTPSKTRAPEANNKADEMHPFGFVDYDEDESEDDGPYTTGPASEAVGNTRIHVSPYVCHGDKTPLPFRGAASSHSSSSSSSSSPAISGLPWLQSAQHHTAAMKRGAGVWEFERESFYAGHKRGGHRIAGGSRASHVSLASLAGLSEAPARPEVDLGSFVPTWQQSALKAHEYASAHDSQNGDTKVPALVNFAMENFELRAQIRSFSQEILHLREKLSKQEAEKKERSSNEWKSRYWSVTEHNRFLEALQLYGKRNFKGIASHVGSRSATQAKTHAQKYFARLERNKGGKGSNGDSAGSSSTSGSPVPDESIVED